MRIAIPTKLESILSASPHLDGVQRLNRAVYRIANDNKTPLFPYYTDHGPSHIEQVLERAIELIPEEVFEQGVLSDTDAIVLTAACLLHDLAMHLSETGFLRLIAPETAPVPLPWFSDSYPPRQGDKPWPMLWQDYLKEASSFGENELSAILGPPPVDGGESHRWRIRNVPQDVDAWSGYDRLAVGEFIRRHHARLAHEIAIYGFPGLSHANFPILREVLPQDLADLCGVVARSHGEPMRLSAAYVAHHHPNVLRPLNSAPLYHMALLRVSDYLQLEPDRAPSVLLKLRPPQSRASIDAWRQHAAVSYVSFEHVDPRAVHVQVQPEHSLVTHLQLKQLLNDIQQEMDSAAAVLSEQYGRVADRNLRELHLAKTIISSNLYTTEFEASLPFFPVTARLEADPKLMAHLIEPFYGHKPEVAVRELVQNAVDAVCERRLLERSTTLPSGESRSLEVDVEILLEELADEGWRVTVADRGVGMTVSTMVRYFLRAGASFRDCDEWRLQFADGSGRSQVIRSGHFGIGVFASFLLAPELRIETRHVLDRTGLGIAATIAREGHLIELSKRPIPFGTSITLTVTRDVVESLSRSDWDWYMLRDPSVSRRIKYMDGRTVTMMQRAQLPGPDADPAVAWNRLRVPGYRSIDWTFAEAPSLVCNGLRVRDLGLSEEQLERPLQSGGSQAFEWRSEECEFNCPSVSVFDPDAVLPLTIRRDALLDSHLPFESELRDDIILDCIAFALSCAPRVPHFPARSASSQYRVSYPGLRRYYACPWIWSQDGVAFLPAAGMTAFAQRPLLVYGAYNFGGAAIEPAPVLASAPVATTCVALLDRAHFTTEYEPEYTSVIDKIHSFLSKEVETTHKLLGLRIYVDARGLNEITRRTSLDTSSEIELRAAGVPLVCVTVGKCGQRLLRTEEFFRSELHEGAAPHRFAAEVFLGRRRGRSDAHLSPLGKRWLTVVGDFIIPFGPDRDEMVKEAASDPRLRKLMESWTKSHARYQEKAEYDFEACNRFEVSPAGESR